MVLRLASLCAVTGAIVGSASEDAVGFEARLGRDDEAGLLEATGPLARDEGGCWSPRLSPETLGVLEGGSVAVDSCAVEPDAGITVSFLVRDDTDSFETWLPAVEVRFEAVSLAGSSSLWVGFVGLATPTASRNRV